MKIFWNILLATSLTASTAIAEDSGLRGELVYKGEMWNVMNGGIETTSRYLHNIDITLEWDLSKSGIDGGTFFIYGLSTNKNELSGDIVGDVQAISNIDNGEVYRLFEAWYQQEYGNIRVKAGLIDLNSEFDAIDTAGLFINSSHGIGPDFSQTGENGPSIFPSTSPAIVFEVKVNDQTRILGGVFDAVPHNPNKPKVHKISFNEGALFIAELEFIRQRDVRFAVGAYKYSSQFDPILSAPPTSRNAGMYGIIESPITETLSGWFRAGIANSTLNPVSHYIGGGIVLSNPFQGREEDQFGFAIGSAWNGNPYKQLLTSQGSRPADAEWNFELSYRYQLNHMIALQPDLQYVVNTGGTKDLKNALVIGVRLEIGLAFGG